LTTMQVFVVLSDLSDGQTYMRAVCKERGLGLPRTLVDGRLQDVRLFTLDLSMDDFVDELKSMIQERCGIPDQQQRLVFAGRVLEDQYTLGDYGLTREAIIRLVHSAKDTTAPTTAEVIDAIEQDDALLISLLQKHNSGKFRWKLIGAAYARATGKTRSKDQLRWRARNLTAAGG